MLHLPPVATVDVLDELLPGHASKQLSAPAVKWRACHLLLQLLAATCAAVLLACRQLALAVKWRACHLLLQLLAAACAAVLLPSVQQPHHCL
jgi:hypothetical protein